MTKILSYFESRKVNVIIIISLIVSIIITNSFVLFSPNVDIRSYNAILTSTLSVGAALVICLVQIFGYKKTIRKQGKIKQSTLSEKTDDKQLHYYYDNNKMHLSICLFLVLWLAAQVIWLSQYQLISSYSIADALWFVGYALFGYFLYSLYYHFFRKEFEPLVLILIAIIILIVMIFVLDIIVSTLRLLSTQKIDFSIVLVTLVYPILDAIMIFPAVLIFWAVRRISKRQTSLLNKQKTEQKIKQEEGKLSPTASSLWILLLSISMVLSAIGDIGFAYSTALGPDIVLRDVWIWGTIFNTDHLCLAAALIGYRYFFSFNRITIQGEREENKSSSN
jgi:hypothetical protein